MTVTWCTKKLTSATDSASSVSKSMSWMLRVRQCAWTEHIFRDYKITHFITAIQWLQVVNIAQKFIKL